MKVLIVDKLSPETVTSLAAARHGSGGRQEPHGGNAARRAGRNGYPRGPLDQGDGGRDRGGAATLAGHPRRGGGRYHRPGRRQRTGHLRRQLSGQEHGGRRRAGHRPADRGRPADRRRHPVHAQRVVAEEGVRQGPRPGRPHAGDSRFRGHRQGGGPAGVGAGDEGRRLVAQPDPGRGRAGRRRLCRLAGGVGQGRPTRSASTWPRRRKPSTW